MMLARKTRQPGLRPAPLLPLTAALGLALAGCGGGGGGAETPLAASSVVLSGVAATGAPLAGAAITVRDSGAVEVCTTSADAQGRYRCDLGATPKAPFTVEASTQAVSLYSTAAVAASATVNVTPLTNLIVARLVPGGNPAALADAIKADPAVVTADRLGAKVAEVAAMLAPLTSAVGDRVDPISGRFDADGTGHDKVLDALQINIRPEATSANIQITIKVQPTSDSSAPVELSFKSDGAAPPPPAVAIHRDDLAADGIAAKVDDFIRRMTACYALPLSARISGVAAGAATANGTAASVQAPECRGLFRGDDPANYLENGWRVGSNAGFPGLFRQTSDGAAFDRGNFEYRWANGDYFITFRSTSRNGAVAHSTLTLRDEGGELKAVGNGYAYDANVRPYAVDREFPLQPALSYFGTGYNTLVVNKIDAATGAPMFKEAIVTRPDGSRLTLRPMAGRSLLGIVRDNGITSGTSVVVSAAAYQSATTPGNPAAKDPAAFLFAADPLSDDRLRAIPDQGVWTIEWVHADADKANVRQSYRTISRALTLGETRQASFAQFSSELKQQWLTREDVAGFRSFVFGAPDASVPNVMAIKPSGDSGAGWTVAEGAVQPTSVTVFGNSPSVASFNDTIQVTGAARSTTVACNPQSVGDTHCDTSTGVTQFAEDARVFAIELWGRSLRQVEMAKHLAVYRLAE